MESAQSPHQDERDAGVVSRFVVAGYRFLCAAAGDPVGWSPPEPYLPWSQFEEALLEGTLDGQPNESAQALHVSAVRFALAAGWSRARLAIAVHQWRVQRHHDPPRGSGHVAPP